MTFDPMASYLIAVKNVEERLRAVRDQLDALRHTPEAVNADAEILFSLQDIETGWSETKKFADIFAKSNPDLARGLLKAYLRCLDGWFDAGKLLSRSEVVSRRFGPKAHTAARAAKAQKNGPIQQAEADFISQELQELRLRSPQITAHQAAPKIRDAVNARLKNAGIPGRPSKPLSVATIARRIIYFSL